MTDESRSTPSDPIEPFQRNVADARTAANAAQSDPAAFSGRTPRKGEARRAGMVVGTGLVVALGAAVAMGASPAPSGQAGAPAAPTQRANGNVNGRFGGPGFGGPGFGGPGFGGPGFGGPGFGADFGRGGPGKGDGRLIGGVSVSAISGSSVSLKTDDGWTRTIVTSSMTTITRGGVAATLSELTVGDQIRFRQTRGADGTYTITAIDIVLPSAAGTVTAVGSDTITITLRDGTSQTIATAADTTYQLGRVAGDRSKVAVGTTIVAIGEKAADGTLTATTVDIRLPHIQGTVTATTADTITITRRDGTTITVHVAAGTTYEVAGVTTPTLANVKAGMMIGVEGTQRADGSIDATDIHAGTFGKGRGHDGKNDDGAAPDASAAPSSSAGTGG